jgi:hypothetical protein
MGHMNARHIYAVMDGAGFALLWLLTRLSNLRGVRPDHTNDNSTGDEQLRRNSSVRFDRAGDEPASIAIDDQPHADALLQQSVGRPQQEFDRSLGVASCRNYGIIAPTTNILIK